ncbi:hypothetical protein GOV09_01355 [Candidatus Woesearchaeota archaeon]|nr:hypothetical protein [Candidatus Woesearchaeota archaeon]
MKTIQKYQLSFIVFLIVATFLFGYRGFLFVLIAWSVFWYIGKKQK